MFKRFEWLNDRVLPYVVMLFIAGTILLPKLPVSDVSGTYIKIRYDDLINVIVLAVWFLSFKWLRKSFFTNSLHQAIFLYWLVGLVSVIVGYFIIQIAPHNLLVLSWVRRIEYMGFFFVGVSATPSLAVAVRYIFVLFASTAIASVYGLGQVFLHWCSISTTNREFSKGICIPLTKGTRPNATFGGQYDLAIFLGFIIPFVLSIFFGLKKYFTRLLLVGLFLIILAMLVLTQSRTAVIAAFLTIAAFLWFYGKKIWIVGFLALALIFVTLFGRNLITRYVTTFHELQNVAQPKQKVQMLPIDQLIYEVTTNGNRKTLTNSAIPGQEDLLDEGHYRKAHPQQVSSVANPALEADLSNTIRFHEEWPTALRAFYREPLLGSGFASFGTLFADQYGFATDNDYLRLLGETGILGFLSFSIIFFVLFRKIRRFLLVSQNALAKDVVIGFLAAIVGLLANAVFIDVFESSKLAIIFWLVCGIVVGVMEHET